MTDPRNINLLRRGTFVILQDPQIDKALVLHHQAAVELARVLSSILPGCHEQLGDCRVLASGAEVHLISVAAGWTISFPLLDTAVEVAQGLRRLAKEAEEIEHWEQLVRDNGLMAWMGLPCGLSDHPQIKRESLKEAEKYCNREVRPPLGIEPRSIVGTPTITAHPPGAHP